MLVNNKNSGSPKARNGYGDGVFVVSAFPFLYGSNFVLMFILTIIFIIYTWDLCNKKKKFLVSFFDISLFWICIFYLFINISEEILILSWVIEELPKYEMSEQLLHLSMFIPNVILYSINILILIFWINQRTNQRKNTID